MSGQPDDPLLPPRLLSLAAWHAARRTPWKAINEIERIALKPLVALGFAWAGVQIGAGWRCYGLPIVQKHRDSTWTIGARLELRSTARANPLGANHPVILSTRRAGAHLTIGDDVGMTGGSIICESSVSIGDRTIIGANSIISDTDFHPLAPSERRARPLAGVTAPVVIGADVFIGMGAYILKGVTIGDGSVIGAGSVVTAAIPPGVIAAAIQHGSYGR